MPFKEISYKITTANSDQTIYTVPAGKEYVVFRTRARDSVGAVVTFKQGSTTFSTVTVKDPFDSDGFYLGIGSTVSEPMKLVLSAGTVVKARSTVANNYADLLGLELPAGTWATVGTNPRSS